MLGNYGQVHTQKQFSGGGGTHKTIYNNQYLIFFIDE